MASTYTLNDAIGYVRSDLAAKGLQFYSDAEITRWLKAAHREFARDLGFYQTTASATTVLNQREYAWPTDCLEITEVALAGTYLTGRSVEWLTSRDPDWRNAAAGTPTVYYLKPFAYVGIHDKPSVAGTTITIYGKFVPTFPASGSATFNIPAQWEDLLIWLADAKTAAKDLQGGGAAHAQWYLDEYNNGLAKALQSAYAGDDVVVGDNARGGAAQFGIPGVNLPISG